MTGRLGDDDSEKNPRSLPSELKTARDILMEGLAEKRDKDKAAQKP